jgi:hypothetical protein
VPGSCRHRTGIKLRQLDAHALGLLHDIAETASSSGVVDWSPILAFSSIRLATIRWDASIFLTALDMTLLSRSTSTGTGRICSGLRAAVSGVVGGRIFINLLLD